MRYGGGVEGEISLLLHIPDVFVQKEQEEEEQQQQQQQQAQNFLTLKLALFLSPLPWPLSSFPLKTPPPQPSREDAPGQFDAV